MRATISRPRSAWVEVDLEQLARNWEILRKEVPASVSLMFVAKDNAYGLGAVPAARVRSIIRPIPSPSSRLERPKNFVTPASPRPSP